MSDFEKYLAKRMKDPAFKAEYDALEPEFSRIQATIDAAKASRRIKSIQAMPNYVLSVIFDDGRHVLYDVKEDMNLPGYIVLRDIAGLFQQVQLDKSRTCVYWNNDVDLPSDTIYEYGREALS